MKNGKDIKIERLLTINMMQAKEINRIRLEYGKLMFEVCAKYPEEYRKVDGLKYIQRVSKAISRRCASCCDGIDCNERTKGT